MSEERTLPTNEETEEPTEEVAEAPKEEKKEFDLASLPEEAKAEFDKLKEERDNYKKGLLKAKEKPKALPEVAKKDDTEEKVLSVMYRENERTALKAIVDSESEHYIPELVDDEMYNKVVAYLPTNLDKSSVRTIHIGLKAALAAYNSIEGKEETNDEGKEAKADLLKSSKSAGSVTKGENKPTPLNIPKREPMTEWYKKKE